MCRTAWDYVNAFLPPAVHTHHHCELCSLSLKLFLSVVYPITSHSIILLYLLSLALVTQLFLLHASFALILSYLQVCGSQRCPLHLQLPYSKGSRALFSPLINCDLIQLYLLPQRC